MLSLAVAAAAGCPLASCLDQTFSFVCQTNDQCAGGGQAGWCEPTGHCSFPSSDCPSGRRYGNYAGIDRTGRCTECGNAVVDPGEECSPRPRRMSC
jgi:hypothetical protein